ncbi:GspH/FimT family pseudopilin [Nitrospira sp. Kam-Ns4a]
MSFTELMVVLAIIGIASVIAVPNFISWNARTQLKEAVLELNSNLNLARMVAMNRNATVTVTLSTVGGHVEASFTAGGIPVMPTQVMSGVTQTTGVSQVQFNSLGLRVGGGSTNQAIQLKNQYGTTYEVQITPAGKTRWCAQSPCP